MQDYTYETDLKGVYLIKRPLFGDDRGFFRELFRKQDLDRRLGFSFDIKQANHSRSQKDTLRGIHIAPWHKLITVMDGLVQQIIVDFQEDSPTFGKYVSVLLGENNWNSLFVPAGCGNGFLVLSESANYCYLTTDYWVEGKEKYCIFNDPDINIVWQTKNPLVSQKDLEGKSVRELFPNKFK